MKPQVVFLSYAKEDADAVRRVRARLLGDGFRPWLDEHDLLPGQDWDSTIRAVIRQCGAFIVFISRSSVTKTGYFQKEIREALAAADLRPDSRVFVLPVRLDDSTPPASLQRWQWVDLQQRAGYQKLTTVLREHAGITPRLRTVRIPPLKNPADQLLYELLSQSGGLLWSRLDTKGYVLSQGHFLVSRSTYPRDFRALARNLPGSRELSPSEVLTVIKPRHPWRSRLTRVLSVDTPPGKPFVILRTQRRATAINAQYWRLALLLAPQGIFYVLPGELDVVYVEQHEEPVMAIAAIDLKGSNRRYLGRSKLSCHA